MYLSRLILNPKNADARRDLGEVHRLHRRVMSAFPQATRTQSARAEMSVLFRVDIVSRTGVPVMLVQSRVQPDWRALPADYLLKKERGMENPACLAADDAYQRLRNGILLRFRLRANPSRKVDTKTGPDGRRRNGRRVKLTGGTRVVDGQEVELSAEEEQVLWLRRKGEQHGFRLRDLRPGVPDVRVVQEGPLTGTRPLAMSQGSEASLTIRPVLFEGILQVTDAERFRQALSQGIGPAKAYGCGLLSIAPARGLS
jgi:CRISPR system Cascade subunit CasE